MSHTVDSNESFLRGLLSRPGVKALEAVQASAASILQYADEGEQSATTALALAPAFKAGSVTVRLDSGKEETRAVDPALIAHAHAVEHAARSLENTIRERRNLPPLVAGTERTDSADGGFGRASNLIQLTNEVIEEIRPDHDSFEIFGEDSSVRFGMKSHELRVRKSVASASFFNGSTDGFADPTFADASRTFPIRYIGAGLRINMFDAASAGILGDNLLRTKMTLATQAVLDLENYVNWFGGGAEDLPGALTYPYLPRKIETVSFTSAYATSNGGQVIYDAFRRSAQSAAHASRSTYYPDTVVMTRRLHDFLDATPMGTSTNHASKSVLEKIQGLKIGNGRGGSANLTIMVADSLKNVGGTNVDGMLFLRRGPRYAKRVTVQGGLQSSPMIQDSAVAQHMVMFKGIGGVVMPEPGHNMLVYVTVDAD